MARTRGGHDKTVLGRIAKSEHPDKRRGGWIGDPWPLCRAGFSFNAALAKMKQAKELSKMPRAEVVEVVAEAGSDECMEHWRDSEATGDDVGIEELVEFFGADAWVL